MRIANNVYQVVSGAMNSRLLARLLIVAQTLGIAKPEVLIRYQEIRRWTKSGFASPSPNFMKRAVLIRNGLKNSTWIETGTYLGGTTEVLSKCATNVISIEPHIDLFKRAKKKLKHLTNVTLLNGLSETLLPEILPKLQGDVCFWLDGHYSSGITFKGPSTTPILTELTSIEKNLAHLDKVVILIDDVRLFHDTTGGFDYPSLDVLVNWSRLNSFRWTIEHDIFVAVNFTHVS